MSAKPPAAFGGLPYAPLPGDTRPLHGVEVQWQWLRPLRAILGFSRLSIDEVISSPGAAAQVRCYWKLFKAAQRQARECTERNLRAEGFWLRRHGCPVPCPACGRIEDCSCAP